MYNIYADDLLFYSDTIPSENVKIIDPHLTLADSAAGSLEFSLPPMNVGYEKIKRMTTDIIVNCDDEEIWRGRVLQDTEDFWKNRRLVCEGELAFLNDSIQPPHRYLSTETTVESFFFALLDNHNAQVEENRRFEHGMVTVTDGDQQDDSDAIYRFTNYETTLECLNDKLVERLGGHLRVRHQDGHRYLDYISDDTLGTNTQVVRFGVNLLEFSKNIDMSELATAIVPRGERLDIDSSDPRYVEGLDAYLTVESVAASEQHDAGSMFVKSPDAISNFGWISAVVDWDNVTDANTLYNKAVKYLQDEQYEKMTLEIQALDLKYLSNSNKPIKFLTKLRCISEPHGMDHTFLVSKMDIDLSNPGNSLYTLGTDITLSLTQAANKVNQKVLEEMEKIPSKNAILTAAQENAFNILMGADGGFVRFEKYDPSDPNYDPQNPDVIHAIVISNGPTDDTSTRKWIWDEGGLGHLTRDQVQDPWEPSNLNVAMTMDGKINCDYLYGGKIYGQEIEGCTITGGTIKGADIQSYSRSTQTAGNSTRITGGMLQVYNDDDHFLRVTSCDHSDSFLGIGGYNCAGQYHDIYYGDDNTPCPPWGICKAGYEASSGSDIKLKNNVNPMDMDYVLNLILNLDPVTFEYKNDPGNLRYGLIAQEVRKVLDENVKEKSKTYLQHKDGEFETVEYKELIAPLIKTCQYLYSEIQILKQEAKKC